MKVLYVEDNDDNIYVIKNRLGRDVRPVAHAEIRRSHQLELVGDVLALGRQSGDLVPEFKLLELPFLVKDRASVHQAFDGAFGELLKRRMRDTTPLRLLGLWDNGFRHLSNKVRPIRAPRDCRGLRIRTQMSKLHGEVFRALGFEPIAADIKQFVEEIAGPTFDAQDNPLTNIFNCGVHHHHRYITLSAHFFGATVMICNEQHYQNGGWPLPRTVKCWRSSIRARTK